MRYPGTMHLCRTIDCRANFLLDRQGGAYLFFRNQRILFDIWLNTAAATVMARNEINRHACHIVRVIHREGWQVFYRGNFKDNESVRPIFEVPLEEGPFIFYECRNGWVVEYPTDYLHVLGVPMEEVVPWVWGGLGLPKRSDRRIRHGIPRTETLLSIMCP
jgi:hypothetical protein